MKEERKPYQPPKIFQVELNQDQAILTACAVGTTNVSTRQNRKCISGTCKRGGAGGNSAAPPS